MLESNSVSYGEKYEPIWIDQTKKILLPSALVGCIMHVLHGGLKSASMAIILHKIACLQVQKEARFSCLVDQDWFLDVLCD